MIIDTGIDGIIEVLRHAGSAWYGSERVTQLQHAVQCAWWAERENAGDHLVVAALFHDIAHLTHRRGQDCAERGIDDRHEQVGSGLLARWYSPAITAPVALHVDAKRYLCACEEGYFESLSPASARSLELQGGIFDPEEARFFRTLPGAENAIRLRRWDDAAKDPLAEAPDLDHFAAIARRCVG